MCIRDRGKKTRYLIPSRPLFGAILRQLEGSTFYRSAENKKDFLGALITFYRTLLEHQMGGSSCVKTAPHKQRKALLGWAQKKKNPERSTAGKAKSPRCPACVGLCEAFAAGVRKHFLAPIPAPVWPFLRGVWKGRTFQVCVGPVSYTHLFPPTRP